jgi:FixJ family two-component response regulator
MKISFKRKTDKGIVAMSRSQRVSIVDDDESVRDAIKSLLKSMGLTADVFASAEEFLNSDYMNDTGCLILDVRMPGMSGFELQHQLVDANCRIPIIFVTAHGDDEEARERAMQSGAIDFLRKPFNEDALLDAVNVALEPGGSGAVRAS